MLNPQCSEILVSRYGKLTLQTTLSDLNNLQDVVLEPTMGHQQEVTGVALRALYNFLQKVDPDEKRSGLERKVTASGSLWLCKAHWQLY
jgi:hypothetical protein